MTSPQNQHERLKRTWSDFEEESKLAREKEAMLDLEEGSMPDIWNEGGPALLPTAKYLCQRQEYNEMIEHYWSMAFMAGPHMRSSPADFQKGFIKIEMEVHSWAWRFGEEDSMLHLSSDDKQAIIASLDGFCVQEDWDKIRSSLPPAARSVFGKVLLETMLNQFIYKKFATSPFWFMDAKVDATDQPGDANFIKRLDFIYQGFKKMLPTNAAWWKSTLVSISTVQDLVLGAPEHTALSRTMHERRKELVKSYVDELWGCRLFRLLLKESLSESLQTFRDDRLHMILEFAAQEFIAGQAGVFDNLVVERLPELAKFDHHSDTMVTHHFHAGSESHHGAQVLLVAEVLTAPMAPEQHAQCVAAAGDDNATQDERIDNETMRGWTMRETNEMEKVKAKGKEKGERKEKTMMTMTTKFISPGFTN
ncbi:hypothetical protein ABZX51_008484 [Aspergillus tubingensis]